MPKPVASRRQFLEATGLSFAAASIAGVRAAAQPRTRLEHQHARARGGEPHRRAQSGAAGADHDHVEPRHVCHSHCRKAMRACRGRGTRARVENTS